MKYIAIITQIWHWVKCYFICISNTWYLITVRNMNKNNLFFSEISQQTDKLYEKVAIITQIWRRTKCYFTSTRNTQYLITVSNVNTMTTLFSEISQQTLKMYE